MIKFFEKYKERILIWLTYIAVFLSSIYPYRDKDWGWHYKYGEYLFAHGKILMEDIYSWTMSGFPWRNHEWLFDPIIYVIFKYSGYIGASLAGALVLMACFYFLTKKFILNYWQLAIAGFFFVGLTQTGAFEGLRSQILALLPLSLLIYVLMGSSENLKRLWLLPPLMLLWVNLHGSFVYGLMIIGIYFAIYFFRFPKKRWLFIGIGLLSILVTLFNPFVLGVYYEALIHSTSPYLQNVFEWMPITSCFNNCSLPSFYVYLVLVVLAFIELPNMQNLPLLITGIILGFLTFNYRRNEPTFVVVTLPIVASYLASLKIDLAKYKFVPFLFLIGTVAVIEYNLVNRLPGFDYYKFNEQDYCKYGSGCSPQLANVLKIDPPQGRGFNFYDWGGYLIGKDVPVKLFIDGRMHLWETSDGYMPFADYVAIYFNLDFAKFNQYGISWVVVPRDSDFARAFLAGKAEGTWVTKFRDETSIYFVKINIQ